MFDFLLDVGNYEERCVGRYDGENSMFISTAAVSDGEQPFETAVAHPDYRPEGLMVIVETYDTREKAAEGHARWVSAMTIEPLPDSLTDISNAACAQFLDALGGDNRVYVRQVGGAKSET